ncbi:MAG: PHP domain-containing protein [Candidatus Gastranaerophilales bacterium]|nr:PHP domain-containing protein [Candidatus Gastranaerophilales bacterium]
MIKEELKNLLISFKEDDFCKNVDLHIHSCESDGKMTPYEIIEQAAKTGKKYISICDHNTIEAYLSTNILKEKIIIPGIEFDCYYKGFLIHILGYGFNIDNKDITGLYSQSKAGRKCKIYRFFNLRKPKEVIEKIKEAGGIAVLAHPACCRCFNLNSLVKDLVILGLEGIEVYYPYNGLRGILKFHSQKEVLDIAQKYNLIKTGGTDSHGIKLL